MIEKTKIPLRLLEMKTAPGSAFLIAGFFFLLAALGLFLTAGYLLYSIGAQGPIVEGDIAGMLGRLLTFFTAPLVILFSAFVCSWVGIHLLKAAGVVTQHVILPQDYELLAAAIRDGNEKAVSEYIRLSSLSGFIGTFTKVGLSGLPLATIVLTIFLAVLGLFEVKFFDLAQLTLGAFLGSYVQKRQTPSTDG